MPINTEKIKKLRKAKELTQDHVATKMGIGRTTYIARENVGDFTDIELLLLAQILETTVEELRGETYSHFKAEQVINELRQTIFKREQEILKLNALLDMALETIERLRKTNGG